MGLALVWLGALNAVLALNVGTCNQGDASELAGGVFTLGLYFFGFALLFRTGPRATLMVGLALPALIAVWHSLFAWNFASGWLSEGLTACVARGFSDLVPGLAQPDGGEAFYVKLWVALSITFWIGLLTALVSAREIGEAAAEEMENGL